MSTKRVHKLKQCANLRLHDENYTSFVVSLLVHKMGRGEGTFIQGGGAYFKLRPMGGALIRRGAYSRREGANSKIYSTHYNLIATLSSQSAIINYTHNSWTPVIQTHLYQTQNYSPWICLSVIFYRLF